VERKMTERKIVSNKNMLFARTETECHQIRVASDSDEYLQVWIKEPTWLQVEQALSSVMDMDAQGQTMGINLNKMYRYMVENFVEKTEPQLSTTDLIRLNPYIGAQLKEILPNPFVDVMGDDKGNEN
jgi:flagellin-specific chaperone FliS